MLIENLYDLSSTPLEENSHSGAAETTYISEELETKSKGDIKH